MGNTRYKVGHGKGRGGRGLTSLIFSTAAVWCVPFCLDCSVPWVYVRYHSPNKLQTHKETQWGHDTTCNKYDNTLCGVLAAFLSCV